MNKAASDPRSRAATDDLALWRAAVDDVERFASRIAEAGEDCIRSSMSGNIRLNVAILERKHAIGCFATVTYAVSDIPVSIPRLRFRQVPR
jgi:hypothetical protein